MASRLICGYFVISISLLSLVQCGSLASRNEVSGSSVSWSCPSIDPLEVGISCQCDLPHTLRCAGVSRSSSQLSSIVDHLRILPENQSISLLDLSIQNVSSLRDLLFERVVLQGLVISSGEIKEVPEKVFNGLEASLTALGLPNNRLVSVPTEALKSLYRLERLDLSNNKIDTITSQQFQGLANLKFLDLSGNLIGTLKPDSFVNLGALKILRLASNRLQVGEFNNNSMKGLEKLRELDLSSNALKGKLPTSFLQGLANLVDLDLSFNNFTLLKRGMLYGLKKLKNLKLQSNQIEVIEDQAFSALTSLSTLDLSHNGVVAVSGQSLSHLSTLLTLDLSHNYLRAVTMDLVAGLSSIQSLDLTDNDISLVQPHVFATLPNLRHLSLADNPLTCDCQLSAFAAWLQNTTSLNESDKRTAICATPPLLENGLLLETDISLLTCESGADSDITESHPDGFLSATPSEDFIRVSSAHVKFLSASMEQGSILHTEWSIREVTQYYTCDAIFIYEVNEDHETLLQSYSVTCDSNGSVEDQTLRLQVSLHEGLRTDKEYRFCLVLFEGNSEDPSLLPGCSAPKRVSTLTEAESSSQGQITAFYANITAPHSVSVYMRIPDAEQTCRFTVAVFQNQQLLATKTLNCTVMSYTFNRLEGSSASPSSDEYEVCATFSTQGQFLPPPRGEREVDGDIVLKDSDATRTDKSVEYSHCVVAKSLPRAWALENTLVVIAISIVFVLISAALLTVTYFLARKIFLQRKKLHNWSSTDPLAIPKTTSRHILYVPEADLFAEPTATTTAAEAPEESSTNV